MKNSTWTKRRGPLPIVPDFEIERVKRGEIRAIDLAREWNVTRQAISARIIGRDNEEYLRTRHFYRPPRFPHHETAIRRWQAMFLFRIGVSHKESAEMLGYKEQSIKSLLYMRRGRKRLKPQLRRWSAFFLMRLGFGNEEIAELTGYTFKTVREYRTWFHRGQKKTRQQRRVGKSKSTT